MRHFLNCHRDLLGGQHQDDLRSHLTVIYRLYRSNTAAACHSGLECLCVGSLRAATRTGIARLVT